MALNRPFQPLELRHLCFAALVAKISRSEFWLERVHRMEVPNWKGPYNIAPSARFFCEEKCVKITTWDPGDVIKLPIQNLEL